MGNVAKAIMTRVKKKKLNIDSRRPRDTTVFMTMRMEAGATMWAGFSDATYSFAVRLMTMAEKSSRRHELFICESLSL